MQVSLLIVCLVAQAAAQTNVRVLLLTGTTKDMGVQYGQQLHQELRQTLAVLLQYAAEHGVNYGTLAAGAELFHARYSYAYEDFLVGVAQGSGLNLTDAKILNGMETLSLESGRSPAGGLIGGCAYLYIPPARSATGKSIVARNYDYPKPYDVISKSLVVAVLAGKSGKVASAIVGLPGQIYCPTCINQAGLLMELNNGGPSGGFFMEQSRKSILINMLEFMQQAETYDRLVAQMRAAQSDYSLIINVAGSTRTIGFEYSSTLGMRPYQPAEQQFYASTNFYLNETWTGLPVPTDEKTWLGVTRRQNLLAQAERVQKHSAQSVTDMMTVRIENGGSVWNNTIYQMVLDTNDLVLHLRSIHQTTWTRIDMAAYFQQLSDTTESADDDMWMIIAIVFISLFVVTAIALLVSCISCKKEKGRDYI